MSFLKKAHFFSHTLSRKLSDEDNQIDSLLFDQLVWANFNLA